MKKLLTLLLGICFAVPAFAADVRKVDNDAWLEHMTQMQALRQQIMSHLTKTNPTFEDRDQLQALKIEFDYKKQAWEKYLQEVAQGNEPEPPVLAKKATCDDHKHVDACKEHKHSHNKHACGKHKHKCADHKLSKDCCGRKDCAGHGKTGKCCKETSKTVKSAKYCN